MRGNNVLNSFLVVITIFIILSIILLVSKKDVKTYTTLKVSERDTLQIIQPVKKSYKRDTLTIDTIIQTNEGIAIYTKENITLIFKTDGKE